MPAKDSSVSSAISRYSLRPLNSSRRSNAAAAVGLPAGVGESCSGLRLAVSAPSGRSPGRDCRIEERSRRAVVELRDHGVRQLYGRLVEAHLAARDPAVNAGVHRHGVIVESAGDFLRGRLAVRFAVSNHVLKRFRPIPGLRQNPVQREQRECARRLRTQNASGLEVRSHRHRVPARIQRAIDETA